MDQYDFIELAFSNPQPGNFQVINNAKQKLSTREESNPCLRQWPKPFSENLQ